MSSVITDPEARREALRTRRGWGRRILDRLRGVSLERRIAAVLMALGGACGIGTIFAFFQTWSTQREAARVTTYLISMDIAITLALGGIVIHRLVLLWRNQRRGQTGARLHARLVLLFALIAVIPTVVVSVFSTSFFSHTLDVWFSQRIEEAVGSSADLSGAYVKELQNRLNNDALSTKQALEGSSLLNDDDPTPIAAFLDQQVSFHKLTEAVLITRLGDVIAQANASADAPRNRSSELPEVAFEVADKNQIMIMQSGDGSRLRALIQAAPDLYLYIGRQVEPHMMSALNKNMRAVTL